MDDKKYDFILNFTKNFIDFNYEKIYKNSNTSNALDFIREIKEYLEKTYRVK